MVGKLTTVLTKKEAEAYCSQGLHKEALGLYKNLLSSSPNLGDSFKDAIQKKVNSIQSELHDDPHQENQMLSAAEIKRIREGWGADATEGDILVCVKAFCQVGHYQDALREITKLIQKGCVTMDALALFAECLVHLCTPEQLLKTIGQIGKKLLSQLEARIQFYLLLTEEMINQKHLRHAKALYQYLKSDSVVCKKAPQRIAAIAQKIELLESEDAGEAGEAQEEKSDEDVVPPSTSENTDEATVLDAEPISSQTTKKKRFGWLPFFKKKNSIEE